jgi:hypothetical protein
MNKYFGRKQIGFYLMLIIGIVLTATKILKDMQIVYYFLGVYGTWQTGKSYEKKFEGINEGMD